MAELNYKIDGVGERTNERVRRERNERFKNASLKKAENESAALDEIQTQRFYDTAVSYYNYREGTDIYSTYSHADILEKFYNDRSWRNNNTISMGADMLATGSDQPLERLQEFSYIQQTYEALPSWWDDPNRTFGGWLMDNGGAMLADPVNLIGFGVGGQAAKQAYKQALNLNKSGADIIDIGGESTRPGSSAISVEEEWKRISKVLNKLKKFNTSLDTRKSSIMEKGIKNKINLINDVSGLEFDKNSIQILKKYKTPFVLQHSQGTPQTMQKNPKYKNVLLDIFDYFETKIKFFRKIGISHNNIILDPGIGFGKSPKQSFEIISRIAELKELNCLLMVGHSRKSFLADVCGNDMNKRDIETVNISNKLIANGVDIVRIHNMKKHAEHLNWSLK